MADETVSVLHQQIEAVAPIDGVSIGRLNDKATWRIDFKPEATAQQRADAQAVVDGFDVVAEETAYQGEVFNFIADPATLRKFVSVVMKEINLLRAAVVPPLPARTLAQLKQAIKDEPEP